MTIQTENRPNVIDYLNQEDMNKIITLSCELGLEIETFEGNLNDSYIIEDTQKLKIDGVSRKNIVVLCLTENIWESSLQLIMTDDYEEIRKYRKELAA